jgi:hypothetical protein
LFSFHKDYDGFVLDDEHFTDIFKFFESYIFTITEDTPYDVNLEINPELLGKMYEGMINATDLDDVDAENGIVYTERPEINFMVRRSLVEVLDKKLNGTDGKAKAFERTFLYHFVFDEPKEKLQLLRKNKVDLKSLRNAITTLTACDPACGSGSMLLGVITVQMGLLRVIDELLGKTHTEKDDFVIKKQLISECIYGVDVKEWAVRIAELRLWLYMISEADFTTEELTAEPLLPNLDFKLRHGNSLLQKFGDLDFTIEDLLKGKRKSAGAARNLNNYIKKKKAFIQNQADSNTTYDELKQEERAVFLDFIRELITEKEQGIHNRKLKQAVMFGSADQKDLFEEESEALKKEIDQLKQLRSFIVKEKRLPFSFDVDFMEVFLAKEDDPGFDLIIGNPPYVRQEEILPPEDGEFLEVLMQPKNKKRKAEVNKAYKEELSNKAYKLYPFLASKQTFKTKKVKEIKAAGKKVLKEVEVEERVLVYGNKLPGRSDLYVYFQLICPHYLNSNGTFCFIISNSWLDVEFGGFVQQVLLKHTKLQAVYDCTVRSFDAAVNTIIYLHDGFRYPPLQGGKTGPYKLAEPVDNTTRFVMNKVDYTQAAYAPLLIDQETCTENEFNDIFRCIPINQIDLFNEGYDLDEMDYLGNKWGGKYLRGPEIYYEIIKKGKSKLKKLKQLSKVVFGIKTGANEFFYLNKKRIDQLKIEAEFLVPVLKSPRECSTIQIDPKRLSLSLFVCNKSKKELKETNALKYIEWGEQSRIEDGKEVGKFHERPSTSGRRTWYDIGFRKFSDGVFPCGIGDSFKVYRNKKVLIDKRLYEVYTENENVLAALNSSLTPLFLEVGTRTGLGDGLMDLTVYEAENTLVIDLTKHDLINYTFNGRPVKSIFEELGFDSKIPFRAQQPNPLPDRKALDNVIFDELGLTKDERNEVYWSVAELVKQRLDKAASR